MKPAAKIMPIDTLIPVRVEAIPGVWPSISRYIDEANRYGGGKLATHDWLAKLLVGAAELFVYPGGESAAICELSVYPRRRVYGIILCGGEGGHDWLRYQAAFEARAHQLGCDSLEIFGRKGWRHIVEQQLGYDFAHWVWRKEI